MNVYLEAFKVWLIVVFCIAGLIGLCYLATLFPIFGGILLFLAIGLFFYALIVAALQN